MRQGPNQRRSRSTRSNGRRSFSHGPNRSFESNGPSVKLRGTAVQVYDKYLALARDATSSGDRIAAENFFQHAEHYFRLMAANAEQQQQRAESGQRREGRDGGGERNKARRGNGQDHDSAGAETPEAAVAEAAATPAEPKSTPSDETVN
jgi:hypothetical protein